MILLTLIADKDLKEPDPESLEKIEEIIWEELNADHPTSLQAQADKVDDDDAVGIFLVDAFHTDEELPFLTPPGALAGFAKLFTLAKAYNLVG